MKLERLMDVHFDLRDPLEIGDGPFGKRVVYDVTGGHFEGERLRGTVLPSGGDWVLFDTEGVARLDVRVILETHDGGRIYVHYNGVVVANDKLNEAISQRGRTEYGDTYFITQPQFETVQQSGTKCGPARRQATPKHNIGIPQARTTPRVFLAIRSQEPGRRLATCK